MRKIYFTSICFTLFLFSFLSINAQINRKLEPIPNDRELTKKELKKTSVNEKSGICEILYEHFEGTFELYINDAFEKNVIIKLDTNTANRIIIYDIFTTFGTIEDSLFLEIYNDGDLIGGEDQFIGMFGDPSLGRVRFEDINGGMIIDNCNLYFIINATPILPDSGYWWGGEFTFALNKIVVPVSETEKLSLIDLYDKSGGKSWVDNTSWITDQKVDYWYGINTESGKVKKINLSNNNLTDSVPNSINNLNSLTELNLSNNKIENISDFSGLISIEVIDISNNKLEFDDLLQLTGASNFATIIYSPQNIISEDTTISLCDDDTLNYTLNYYSDASHQWFFNGDTLDEQTSYILSLIMSSDIDGEYYCEITHSDLPDLTLKTGTVSLSTLVSVGSNLSETKFTVMPNPSTGLFYIELSKEINRGQIQVITLNGTILSSKPINQESSYQFDISEQPKGIYLVRIVQNEKIATQKIILQ